MAVLIKKKLAATAGFSGWSCLLLALCWTHSSELFLGRKLQQTMWIDFICTWCFISLQESCCCFWLRNKHRKQLSMFVDWLIVITWPMTSAEGNLISASGYTRCGICSKRHKHQSTLFLMQDILRGFTDLCWELWLISIFSIFYLSWVTALSWSGQW